MKRHDQAVLLLIFYCGSVSGESFGNKDTLKKHVYTVQMRCVDNNIRRAMVLPEFYQNNSTLLLTNVKVGDNGMVNKHIKNVLKPFLEVYYKNMTDMYAAMTDKMAERTKSALNESFRFKDRIIEEMNQISDSLNATDANCSEERRDIRTTAFELLAKIYKCTQEAVSSVSLMDSYFGNLMIVTRAHMNSVIKSYLEMNSPDRCLTKEMCTAKLSSTAVGLAFELDIGLTNAKKYYETTSDDFLACYKAEILAARADRAKLVNRLHYCVEA